MIFEIQKNEFLNHIQKVQSIIEMKGTVPILMNVRIQVDMDGLMVITATDMDVSIRDSSKVTVESSGSITVSAKKLYEVLKELSEGIVRFEVQENNWINLTCASSKMKLVGTPDLDFPKLPAYDEKKLVGIPAENLDFLLRKTIYAVSTDPNRYIMNGVYWQVTPETIRAVATDGHRLAYADMANTDGLSGMETVIPRKCIHEALRMTGSGDSTIEFGLMEHHIVFRRGGEVIISRKVEGQFPNYSMVVPAETKYHIHIERKIFLNALRRVSLFSDLEGRGIKLTMENNMMFIDARTPEYGEAKDEIAIEYDGETMHLSFNANYLLELLRIFDSEEISMEVNEASSPVLFKPVVESGNYYAVVMPMVL